jgi:hypothetical protein
MEMLLGDAENFPFSIASAVIGGGSGANNTNAHLTCK